MKNKKLTALLILVLPIFLTACTIQDLPLLGQYFGNKEAPVSSNPVNLNVWGLWEAPEVMEAVSSKYQALNPNITVKYDDRSVIQPDQYKQTLLTRLVQGDTPDIVLIHNTWVKDFAPYLESMPVSLMSSTDYAQKFYPVATDSAVIDGSIYAIPMYYDGIVLVYNKDHFDEVDQLTPPTAWEEFRRLALSLTVRDPVKEDVIIRSGAAIGSADNIEFSSDILGLMFSQAGVSIPEGLNSRAAQDALSFYTAFVTEDMVWSTSFGESVSEFVLGNVSMIFIPSWRLLDILNAAPEMQIGVAEVPQAIPENPASWGSFWMYAVPQGSANAKVAWDFLNYLSEDEQQLMIFNEASKYRAYGAPFSSTSLSSQLSTSAVTNNYLKPVINGAPFSKTGIITAKSGNKVEEKAMKDAINAVITPVSDLKLTPEEALNVAKESIVAN